MYPNQFLSNTHKTHWILSLAATCLLGLLLGAGTDDYDAKAGATNWLTITAKAPHKIVNNTLQATKGETITLTVSGVGNAAGIWTAPQTPKPDPGTIPGMNWSAAKEAETPFSTTSTRELVWNTSDTSTSTTLAFTSQLQHRSMGMTDTGPSQSISIQLADLPVDPSSPPPKLSDSLNGSYIYSAARTLTIPITATGQTPGSQVDINVTADSTIANDIKLTPTTRTENNVWTRTLSWTPSSTVAKLGKRYNLTVKAIDNGLPAKPQTSSVVALLANNAPTGTVSITGTTSVGKTLTAKTTALKDADGISTLNYQWLANNVTMPGATEKTLMLTSAEKGKTLTLTVSYTDLKGTLESVTSAKTKVIK